jgi:hypothetical protein
LRTEYKDAIVRIGHRKAFDNLVESWLQELEAYIKTDSFPLMDMIILTGEIDNRMILKELQDKIAILENEEKTQ